MEYLIVLSAIPIGLLVGLLPAVSNTLAIVMMFGLINALPFNAIIAFYAALTTASQFSGSVSALWLGVAGEVTSIPVLAERDEIIKKGQLRVALFRTALGSGIAAVLGGAGLALVMSYSQAITPLLSTNATVGVFAIIVALVIFWSANKRWVNLLLAGCGLLISVIGYDRFLDQNILTFNQTWLLNGVPFIPFLLGVYAIPALLRTYGTSINEFDKSIKEGSAEPLTAGPVLRGSIIGFIIGVLPFVGALICSNAAHWVERRIKSSTPLSRVTSAEAADNSASMSVLAPLLLFGIAVQPSEAIIVSILMENGWAVSQISANTYIYGGIIVVLSIVVCYLMCVNYVEQFISVMKDHKNSTFAVIATLIIGNVVYLGIDSGAWLLYVGTLIVGAGIGVGLSRLKVDVLPLLFMWLIGDQLYETLSRFIQLNFS